MSNPKWIVSLKTGEGHYSSKPGRIAQSMWQSRQPTAALALEEGAEVLGVPTHRCKVTAWGELDWSETPVDGLIKMDKHGNYAAEPGESQTSDGPH